MALGLPARTLFLYGVELSPSTNSKHYNHYKRRQMSETLETPSIAFTESKYKKFKKAFREAEKEKQESFTFEDKPILVTYARYIIEYLSSHYE
jgi:septin family protein